MVLRPVVSVYSSTEDRRVGSTVMPKVFSAPLRSDLVKYVHTNMSKNRRQAYAVSKLTGYQTSARSWGTGRAMARVPRVKGGGTHRAGQAAYANFCRAGGMYAPTKVWRRWHRKINLKERRQSLASAVASTSVVPLVMARGHRVESVGEIPLVVDDSIENLTKTRDAVSALYNLGLGPELERVAKKKHKAGRGKSRGRSTKRAVGPLIILRASAVEGKRAFRNIPGVEVACVERLNLLKLAPAGTLGRLCVWSKSAFELVDKYVRLPASKLLTNADVCALVNSTEVQTALKPQKTGTPKVTIKRGCSKKVLKFVRKVISKTTTQKQAADKDVLKERKKRSKKFFRDIEFAFSSKPLELEQ